MLDTKAKAAHVWKRDALDWYVEEDFVTRALAKVERFVGSVLDPCCGQGNIVTALLASGVEAVGSDIVERAPEGTPWFLGTADFREVAAIAQPNICMNPPFFRAKGAEAFIRKALSLASGKVAAFTDIKFLASDGRAKGLYAEFPPNRIWSISPRPSCPPGEYLLAGGEADGGTADYVWLVWDLTAPPPQAAQFLWLRAEAVLG
ncbi:hypothetical protein [Mesorhizobium sp.]|uniref:hypothetical protein n=1 Tax=Mesorhizobium sp. TaxID=1871066 RepID=UPI000FE92C2C|nr:hypothetical protein [Mesorhizobium sp.]RWM29441.1 MAG: hypothetical protein EOR74_07110 [Mesorhizobium sp.]